MRFWIDHDKPDGLPRGRPDGLGAGERAAKRAGDRFAREGRAVEIIRPPTTRGDFNDVLTGVA